ncbi:tryptophan synthase subunit alpha [Symmachiella dynata]|nr:tryptophan synthase subunit alpha [Symmachiella dynata]
MTTPISKTFAQLKADGRMAFMPFITAGDPDIETTAALIRELAAQGVDLIEIGFPYSDPIADGPVIQASYTRALERKLHVDDIFACVQSVTESATGKFPNLVAMVAYAIVLRVGPETFVAKAKAAGFVGFIIPDLPADEAEEMTQIVRGAGLDLIQLIAPTTTRERTAKILELASGFLYCISIAGTTGVRDDLPPELYEQLEWLKTQTDVPLAVGFGVSRPEQVEPLRKLADGVIVGSAIVRAAEKSPAAMGELAAAMTAAAHGG